MEKMDNFLQKRIDNAFKSHYMIFNAKAINYEQKENIKRLITTNESQLPFLSFRM
jgi:hypothetical protein